MMEENKEPKRITPKSSEKTCKDCKLINELICQDSKGEHSACDSFEPIKENIKDETIST